MPNNLFLVDTSAWIFALRKDFMAAIKDRISQLLKDNTLVISGMVKLEILGGAKSEKEFQKLKNRLDALDSIETDASLWEKACERGFRLRRMGITVPRTDVLIGACALKAGATLVHADAHFDLMANHVGIKVESFVHAVQIHQRALK